MDWIVGASKFIFGFSISFVCARCISRGFYSTAHEMRIGCDYVKFRIRDYTLSLLGVAIKNVNRITIITYYKGDDKYKIAVQNKIGMKPIKSITLKSIYDGSASETDCEILQTIQEFAGPNRDFHGVPTTPYMIGLTHPIVVTYTNNAVREYKDNEIIGVVLPV